MTYDSATNTLTWTSPAEGASMPALNFSVPAANDLLVEGPESYAIDLSNPTSTTGVTPSLGIATATTEISDTQGEFGPVDGPAEWSVTGPAQASEGSTAQFIVSLAGQYQQNEVCLLYTSPSPRDATLSRMPSSA